jgi:hypothetical protein
MHRIELPVRIPQFTEDVRTELLDRIAQLQVRNPTQEDLRAAVTSARRFLEQRDVREWFAAQDLWTTLEVGWSLLGQMTPDGFRTAARDFDALTRVIASWSPAFEQPRVTVENLGEAVQSLSEEPSSQLGRAPGVVAIPFIDSEAFPQPRPIRVNQLGSRVTLGEDSSYGIFIAGRFERTLPGGEVRHGANGSFWSFPSLPGNAVFEELGEVRPDRLFLLAPAFDHPALRQRFEGWNGGSMDSTPSPAQGPVSSGDLASLVVLKTWLDAKVIEAGWWGQVNLRIDGVEGSRLIIEADTEQEEQIQAWIAEVAEGGLDEEEFLRVRSAARGSYDRLRRDLQLLLWQRDPSGTLPLPDTVNQRRLRDVARIYF